ncbi:hypothetical protein SKAU_G00367000 [Synaphobranchus kaupii]|uniref:Uncharacterized protein n=1 Tax=Synaphobranchus kaupii TaxID=118154 RepID=A0A9Q1EFA4_SYNKA|nr:hypothetical protein SKAU_G00367000 [Synaphobranchus kaupii]
MPWKSIAVKIPGPLCLAVSVLWATVAIEVAAPGKLRSKFRLDGSLFNLPRLQTITKATATTIHELNNCALLTHSPATMLHPLDGALYGQISEASGRPGSQKHRYEDHLKGILNTCAT